MFDFKNLVSLSLLFSVILNTSQAEAGKRKIPNDLEETYKTDLPPALFDSHFFDSIEHGDESLLEPNTSMELSSQKGESSQNSGVQIIKGYDAHRKVLVDMLDSSKREIIISSKSIAYQPSEIYHRLKSALDRRVKITIYADNSQRSFCDKRFHNFATKNGIQIIFLNIHSKFFIIDGKSSNGIAVIGSHNWLSERDDSEGVNGDSSFLISDPDAVSRLRGKTFQTVIKYSNLKTIRSNSPQKSNLQEEIKNINIITFSVGNMTFKYLSTLRHHEGVLKHLAAEAKERMLIYSPFFHKVSAKKRLEEVFSTLNPNVRLTLRVSRRDKRDLLKLLIENYWLPRVNIKIKEDSHRKTLKIDRHIRVDGSFNWLSASTDDNSDHHNMETSLILISNEDEKN